MKLNRCDYIFFTCGYKRTKQLSPTQSEAFGIITNYHVAL